MTEHASLVTLERRPDGVALVMIDNLPVISDDELDDAVRP